MGAFHVAGNKLYFNVGSNLSVTDGTSTGTQVIGSVGISASNLAIPLGTGNLLVFTGRDDLLWRSDGTVTGTYQIPAAGALLYPGGLVAFGTEVYFSAWEAAVGNELWKTDGANPPGCYRCRPITRIRKQFLIVVVALWRASLLPWDHRFSG